MKTKFIENREIEYTGEQLSSLFAFRNFDLQGDSVVSFIGKCDVKIERMVDLADVKEGKSIFSEKMLHFIGEFFDRDLGKLILRERLLTAVIFEEIVTEMRGLDLRRDGDDIYSGSKKATVGIATLSPVSSLFHVGINVSSQNTPVETIGLDDLGIEAKNFATEVLDKYSHEMKKCLMAGTKVRGVK